MSVKKNCVECAFCEVHGEGYSEWTITGNSYVCMLGLRDDINDDGPPEEEVRGKCEFAEQCESFLLGTGPRVGLYCEDRKQEMADWVRVNFRSR
jgi:hypothetical protein